MAPKGTTLHLPHGQTVTVSHNSIGYEFKANNLNVHHSAFPPGWTIVIDTAENDDEEEELDTELDFYLNRSTKKPPKKFTRPTLRHDNLFISSISNPSSDDFKPAASPTRQIAMMLWTTLWWYFHLVSAHTRSAYLVLIIIRRPPTHMFPQWKTPTCQPKACQRFPGG